MIVGQVIREDHLPNSVPLGRTVTVKIIVNPPLDGQHLTFLVVADSNESGSATIVGNPQLYTNGEIEVLGVEQTTPGHSGGLRIRAILNGEPVGESPPFSVCSHPKAVEYGLLGPVDIPLAVGMRVSVTVLSDSGDTTHLIEVVEKELVSDSFDHTANLGGVPRGRFNQNNKFKPAHTVPPDNHTVPVAQAHVLERDRLLGASGSWSNDQLDLFVCLRCGMKHPAPIRQSGYRIIRTIFTEGGQLHVTVRKEPRDVLIDGIPASAGPSEVMAITLLVPPYPLPLPPPKQ